MDPQVTITTVLYNSGPALAGYAAAIEPVLRSGLARLVAVDNASPDNSAEILRKSLPEARIVINVRNLGFAGGCNSAWPAVETTYWLLLNPDVEVTHAGIERLVRWMDTHADIGVATPRLRGQDGAMVPVARAHDSLWRPMLELLRLHKLVPEPYRSAWLLSGGRSTPEKICGWVPGAALIARTEAVARVGPLDDGLFLYGEDREWCWRMTQSGWGIGVCPTVEFTHIGGTSAKSTWDERERIGREVAGHLAVTRRIRGASWARLFSLCIGVILGVESRDPRRDLVRRSEARLRSGFYLRAARDGRL